MEKYTRRSGVEGCGGRRRGADVGRRGREGAMVGGSWDGGGVRRGRQGAGRAIQEGKRGRQEVGRATRVGRSGRQAVGSKIQGGGGGPARGRSGNSGREGEEASCRLEDPRSEGRPASRWTGVLMKEGGPARSSEGNSSREAGQARCRRENPGWRRGAGKRAVGQPGSGGRGCNHGDAALGKDGARDDLGWRRAQLRGRSVYLAEGNNVARAEVGRERAEREAWGARWRGCPIVSPRGRCARR